MALEAKDLEHLKPDSLSGKSLESKAERVASNKVALKPSHCFLLACMAGLYIGFGAIFFLTFTADPTLSFGVKKLVGGICFCLGLSLVILCGGELFTGNALMVFALLSKKIKLKSIIKNWVIVLIGNAVGSLVLVALVAGAAVASIKAGDSTIGANMASVAAGKINLDWLSIFCRGILCNILVCLAVYVGFAGKTVVDKVAGIILPIAGFVACGFEHCIANMFFLPMGMVADPSMVHVEGILWNLSASIPGNIVGGAVFVALVYWIVYHSEDHKK